MADGSVSSSSSSSVDTSPTSNDWLVMFVYVFFLFVIFEVLQ